MSNPPVPPPPDYGDLLGRLSRAELILRNATGGADRFTTGSRVLCEFYRVLDADDAFWDEVEHLTEDQPDVDRLFADLAREDFEDREYQLLTEAGVDEIRAAELASDFKNHLEQYQPGSLPSVRRLRDDLRQVGYAVCDAANAFANHIDEPRQRRSRLKLLARALYIGAAVVGILANIPAVLVPSVYGGVMTAAGVAAEILDDRAKEG